MPTTEINIYIASSLLEDADDCFQAAEDLAIAACPELDGWDLDVGWDNDDARDTVCLSIPLEDWSKSLHDVGFRRD